MFIDVVYDLYSNPRHPCTWSACVKRLEHERRDKYNTIYRQVEFTVYVSDNKKQTISEVDDTRNHFHRFLSAIRDAVCQNRSVRKRIGDVREFQLSANNRRRAVGFLDLRYTAAVTLTVWLETENKSHRFASEKRFQRRNREFVHCRHGERRCSVCNWF